MLAWVAVWMLMLEQSGLVAYCPETGPGPVIEEQVSVRSCSTIQRYQYIK